MLGIPERKLCKTYTAQYAAVNRKFATYARLDKMAYFKVEYFLPI